MLHTEETVRAGIRVKDGSRVYYLPEGDRLTPSAQDWLRNENVRILRPQDAPPKVYTTLSGGTLTGKPEHMTHLYGNVLVPKDHPRIAFRGMIDALEAEILLCQSTAAQPVAEVKLCGLDAQALREHSHHPEKYYGQPHFMPSYTDGSTLLQLNRVRTLVRQTELACYRAFSDRDGAVTREDMILALNRLSSLCWILMIRCKANQL